MARRYTHAHAHTHTHAHAHATHTHAHAHEHERAKSTYTCLCECVCVCGATDFATFCRLILSRMLTIQELCSKFDQVKYAARWTRELEIDFRHWSRDSSAAKLISPTVASDVLSAVLGCDRRSEERQ